MYTYMCMYIIHIHIYIPHADIHIHVHLQFLICIHVHIYKYTHIYICIYNAGGSLGDPRSTLGASSGCHWGGLRLSKGYLEIIAKPVLFIRFLQSVDPQNAAGSALMLLQGSRAL